MTERRAVITWFPPVTPDVHQTVRPFHVMTTANDKRAIAIAELMLSPIVDCERKDGVVVLIGTNGEYLDAHLGERPGHQQHYHVPMNGLTPQFG